MYKHRTRHTGITISIYDLYSQRTCRLIVTRLVDFNYLFMITVVGGGLDWSHRQYLQLGRDKCVSSYEWILHVDWWVDFVYFTNLPFSMEIYVYLDKTITLYNIPFV